MFATIDIGTNSVLLLIGEILSDGKVRVIADEARLSRLGEGISARDNLNPEAAERTIAVLKEYRELCEKHHVSQVAAVATEVLRQSTDTQEFLNRAKNELGLEISVIGSDEEAWLTYFGSAHDFGSDIVVCDIGGGSTELVWGKSKSTKSKPDGNSHRYLSIPMGSVVLTEQFIKSDPISPEDSHELVSVIDQRLSQALHQFSHRHAETMIATGGTATTLAAISKSMTVYDQSKIHGSVIEMLNLQVMIEELKRLKVAERRKIPGIQKGREDVILTGAAMLDRVMRKLGYDTVKISARGLRWGLFYERFARNKIAR